MKNFIFLLVLTLICGLAFGAAPQKLRVDQVQIGISGSAGAKDLSFDFGQGANNPKIQNDGTNFNFNQGSDFTGNVDVTGNFSVTGQTTKGDGTNATNLDTYNLGLGLDNPYYGYDSTLGAMVFKNPGGPVKKMGSGSGGGEGGINIVLNGKAEDGLVNWTNTGAGAFTEVYQSAKVLEGEKSFKFDSINTEDAVTSDLVTLNDGLIGASCEARIYYKGGDANLSFELVNGNGTVLKTQAITPHPIASHESLFFLCPNSTDIAGDANKGKLAVRVRQSTATNAIAITFDNMYLGSLIGLVETTLPDILVGKFSGLNGAIVDDGGFIQSITRTGLGSYIVYFKGLTVAPIVSGALVNEGNNAGAVVCRVDTDATVTQVNLGCYATSGNYTDTENVAITIRKQSPDAKQTVQVYKSIPKIADNVNALSFSMNGAGAVVSDTFDVIDGNCSDATAGTGYAHVCPLKLSVSEKMACVQGGETTAANLSTNHNPAANTISIVPRSTTNASAYQDILNTDVFTVICVKQGADFKMPTVQPVIVGQVTNSYAEAASKNVRIESCQINDNGTVTLESVRCAPWIQSTAKLGTGIVRFMTKSGIFSDNAECFTRTSTGNVYAQTIFRGSVTQFDVSNFVPNTGALANQGYYLLCIGAK